jgi:hypothetical protein
MNVVTRIITDENISQLTSLSYSDTFQSNTRINSTETLETSMKYYLKKLRISHLADKKIDITQHIGERVISDELDKVRKTDSSEYIVPNYDKGDNRSTDSSEYIVPNYDKGDNRSTDSSEYIVPNYDAELPSLKMPIPSYENVEGSEGSPPYAPYSPAPIDYDRNSPNSFNLSNSPQYAPYSPAPIDYDYDSNDEPLNIFNSPKSPKPILGENNGQLRGGDIRKYIKNLSLEQQKGLLERIKNRGNKLKKDDTPITSIFDVNEPAVKELIDNVEKTRKISF